MTKRALAIVTGASGNLGSAVVKHLLAGGYQVARVERSHVTFDGASIADIDLTSGQSTRDAFARIASHGPPLWAVVHTVGAFRAGTPLTAADDAEFGELFQTNVLTTLHVVQAALALMIPQNAGRIVAVASLDALAGGAGRAAYAATKAAQLRTIESAAADVRGTPITVNAVLPGTMDTPANRSAMPNVDPATWVRLDEVANVLAFLVSDAASGIHGQAIRVERS
jgi:3-oxoacyl-[acyl-carrier protein] reductase